MKLHDKRALMFDKPTSVIAAAGNGHIAFNGARNVPLKSAVFYGACEQKTLAGKNLFDTSLVPMDGKYVASKSGDLVVNSAWQHSGYIPVTAGIRYRFVASHSSTSNAGMAWYNLAKTYISGVSAGTMRSSSIITAPANAAYARISWNIPANPEWESTVWFYDYDEWGAGAVWEEYCGGIPSPNPDYPQPIKSNNSKWGLNNDIVDISAIKLYKISNAQDTYDAISGMLIKKIGHIPSYGGEEIVTDYKSTTGTLSVGAEVIYVLPTPTTEHITPQVLRQIKGDNLLRQISGDIENTAVEITYYGRT